MQLRIGKVYSRCHIVVKIRRWLLEMEHLALVAALGARGGSNPS
jgi:hypothetical protein